MASSVRSARSGRSGRSGPGSCASRTSHFSRHSQMNGSVSRNNPLYDANQSGADSGQSYYAEQPQSQPDAPQTDQPQPEPPQPDQSQRQSKKDRRASMHSTRSNHSSRSNRSYASSMSSASSDSYQERDQVTIVCCPGGMFSCCRQNKFYDDQSSVSSVSTIDDKQSEGGRFASMGDLFGGGSKDKNGDKSKDDQVPVVTEDRDEDGAPMNSQPIDAERGRKRAWLICKGVFLLFLLTMILTLFIVVLVVIQDNNFDDDKGSSQLMEAVIVPVSMVLARPFNVAYNQSDTEERLYLVQEYQKAMQNILQHYYLGPDLLYVKVEEISRDPGPEDCTYIKSKLIFKHDVLELDPTHMDDQTYRDMVNSKLGSIGRNIEAIILADAAKLNGEIRQLHVKVDSITVYPGSVELVPKPPSESTTPKPTKTATDKPPVTARPPPSTRPPLPPDTERPVITVTIPGSITILGVQGAPAVYTPALADPNSGDYRTLQFEVVSTLNNVFNPLNGFLYTDIITFRAGSIIADFRAEFLAPTSMTSEDLARIITAYTNPDGILGDSSLKLKCGYQDFQCANGYCIPYLNQCDSIEQCPDGSDEQGCEYCTPGNFLCNNANCIPEGYVCDNFDDCGDNSDEVGCSCDPVTHFQCLDGSCVNVEFKCDGYNDCFDGSDEHQDVCGQPTRPPPPPTTEAPEEPCPPGVELVRCLVNPCDVTYCYLNPLAICVPNYCGGCNADFYDFFTGEPVTCWNECPGYATRGYLPHGPVTCSYNPCEHARCPLTPNAFCQANNCGGCNAVFYDQPVSGYPVLCQDTIGPTIHCNDVTYHPVYPWQAGTLVYFEDALVYDNVGVAFVSYSTSSGDFFYKGDTKVTVTAGDRAGNYGYCEFTVTVPESDKGPVPPQPTAQPRPPTQPPILPPTEEPDTEPPTIFCPNAVNIGNDPGEEFATVNWDQPIVYENSNHWTVTTNREKGYFEFGVHEVTLTASDNAGNSANCTFTVTVFDNEPPEVVCPRLATFDADPGVNTALIELPTSPDNITVTDNSRMAPTVAEYQVMRVFPLGETKIVINATDSSGNVGSCVLTVNVKDNQDPVVSCPGHMTIFTFNEDPYQRAIPHPVVTDNDGPPSLRLTIDFAMSVDIDLMGENGPMDYIFTFTPGWHFFSYFAKDKADNEVTCSFQIEHEVVTSLYEAQIDLTQLYTSSLGVITSDENKMLKQDFETQITLIMVHDTSTVKSIFRETDVTRFTRAPNGQTRVEFKIGFTENPANLRDMVSTLINNNRNQLAASGDVISPGIVTAPQPGAPQP